MALIKKRHHGGWHLKHVECFYIESRNGCRYFGRISVLLYAWAEVVMAVRSVQKEDADVEV